MPGFQIGIFHFGRTLDRFDSSTCIQAINECFGHYPIDAQIYLEALKQSQGLSLVNYSRSNISVPVSLDISVKFAKCAAPSMLHNQDFEELFNHLSLISWPQNYATAKNYAYGLEVRGFYHPAHSLYLDCYILTLDLGCNIHVAMVTPMLSYSTQQTQYTYLSALRTFYRLLRSTVPREPTADDDQYDVIYNSFREMPLSAQYLGYGPGILFELMGRSLRAGLSITYQQHSIPPPVDIANSGLIVARDRKVRIGLVSEHVGNTSPGLTMQSVFQHIFTEHGNEFELVFFDRPGLITVFGYEMRLLASEIVFLLVDDFSKTAELIANTHLDIIIYLALPSDKQTYLLSGARLAPIGIQIGIGHPLSAGSPPGGIDYTIVPIDMLPDDAISILTQQDNQIDGITCAMEAYLCDDQHVIAHVTHMLNDEDNDINLLTTCNMHTQCYEPRYSTVYYNPQQLVVFDSQAHAMLDPISFHANEPGKMEALYQLAMYRDGDVSNQMTCEQLDALLELTEVPADVLRARDLFHDCDPSSTSTSEERRKRKIKLYFCLQFAKKFHPRYDEALLGIIAHSNMTRIIVSDELRVILPRWHRVLTHSSPINKDMSVEELEKYFIFVPRIPHPAYLALIGLSSVFLNPVVSGAGMTSSEAIAMCTPIITWPDETVVLHFAMLQLKALQLEEEDYARLTARGRTAEDYIHKSTWLADEDNKNELKRIRDVICANRHRIFGAEVAKEAGEEWVAFMRRLL